MSKHPIDEKQLMMYRLGWLAVKDAEQVKNTLDSMPVQSETTVSITYFLQNIQHTWLKKQAIRQQRLEAKLDRIITWVEGDATAETITLAQQDIAEDSRCRAFYDELTTLSKHLEEVDRINPLATVRAWRKRLQQSERPSSAPALRPVWALRGDANAPIKLAVPSEYGFHISLFVGGFERQRKQIRGKLYVTNLEDTLPDNLVGASIWLLPQPSGKWHQTTINNQGVFNFADKIPPGSYALEMAWPGEFLEVLDVVVPAN